MLLAVDLALDVRAVFADSDHTCAPLWERDRRDLARIDGVEGLFDAVLQPGISLVEAPQERIRLAFPGGDVIEDLLHLGGKSEIDELLKLTQLLS